MESSAGTVKAIAKENGLVAVVLLRGGEVVKGYAEIRPPRRMSAQQAAVQIRWRVTGSGSSPKVTVILPPGWGTQATNPAAAVRVIDVDVVAQEEAAEQRSKYVEQLRNAYREYIADVTGGEFGDPTIAFKSDAEVLKLQANADFLKWLQRRRTTSDYKAFREQNIAMGWNEDQIKDAWKNYRAPELENQEKTEAADQALKYDTEKALHGDYAWPAVRNWLAKKPQPVEETDASGRTVKRYKLQIDGIDASLSEAQYRGLREMAVRKLETALNSVENDRNRYQFVRDDRGGVAKSLDLLFGAELEGKAWAGIDASVKAARAALKEGEIAECLKLLDEARERGAAARREYDRFLHNREVGAEVTIQGLEYLKDASECVLAVASGGAGGLGLVIVTGKGVTESVLLAAVKSSGQHVDWGDVGFEVGTQVVSAALTHGMGKLVSLGPKNVVMNSLREHLAGRIATDAVQSIVLNSVAAATKAWYEQARGRGEAPTPKDAARHFMQFLSDPAGLPKQIVEAQVIRHLAPHVAKSVSAQTPAQSARPGA